MTTHRSKTLAIATLATLTLLSGSAWAAGYPERAIRVVVPTATGTPIDIVTRIVTHRMAKDLGQTLFVENKPGATGNVGGQDVLRSAADGYTLMTVFMPMSVAPALLSKVPFDIRKDFVPVGQTAWSYNVLVLHPSVDARTMPEFIRLLKAQPGKLSYATGGLGTPAHVTGELFKLQTQTFALHIPYNQFGQAITDLLGGTHQFMFAATAAVAPFIEQGKLRPLAVTSPKRLAGLPQVPTMAEVGHPELSVRDWQGLVAKAGTPPEVVARLNAAIAVALADDEVKQSLAKLGVDAAGGSPEDLGKLIRSEVDRWAEVVKRQNLKAD